MPQSFRFESLMPKHLALVSTIFIVLQPPFQFIFLTPFLKAFCKRAIFPLVFICILQLFGLYKRLWYDFNVATIPYE
jgi:hypothetical protein